MGRISCQCACDRGAAPPRAGTLEVHVHRLERLNVEYRRIHRDDKFPWYTWINKTAALRHVAESHPGTIVWLDPDVIVLDDIPELWLDPENPNSAQFAACAPEQGIGTARDDDEHAPYFRAVCETLRVDFQSIPYIVTERDRVRIRAYWNAGIYAFVGASGFAALQHEFTLRLLASGVVSHRSWQFFSEPMALTLAAHQLKLRYKALPLSYNFSVQPDDARQALVEAGKTIKILHYHGCLWPDSFDALVDGLGAHCPEAAAWLRERGPITLSKSPPSARIYRKLLQLQRDRKERAARATWRYY